MKFLLSRVLILIVVLTLLVAPQIVNAQNSWSLEIRGGLNNTTQKLGDAELGSGLGSEVTILYSFIPKLGAYLGWGWNNFNAESVRDENPGGIISFDPVVLLGGPCGEG